MTTTNRLTTDGVTTDGVPQPRHSADPSRTGRAVAGPPGGGALRFGAFGRSFRSELVKLWRRRPLVVASIVAAAFSIVATVLVVTAAEPAEQAAPVDFRLTTEALSDAGGGTEAFRTAISFAGVFVFVVFVGLVAAEFSRGNIRTMLIRQPSRAALLAGKLGALLASAAVVLAGAEVVSWITARIVAGDDITTTDWTSLDAVGHALGDYGAAVFWVAGYALFGTALAVAVRSVPLALGIGIGWSGPFEHIVVDSWSTAGKVFPGLLLEAFVAGGTTTVGFAQAFITVGAYMVVAAAAAVLVLRRLDIT